MTMHVATRTRRMRKGTHSCWECRRRKRRCSFEPGGSTVCSQCYARGSACVDQRSVVDDTMADLHGGLRERVSRLEAIVDDIADRRLDQSSDLQKSADLDIVAKDTVPLMSLFDNAVLSCSERDTADHFTEDNYHPSSEGSTMLAPGPSQRHAHGVTHPNATPTAAQSKGSDDRYQRARSALLLALPPFATILRTIQGKSQWWEQWQQKTFGPAKQRESLSQFTDRVYRRGHPAEVGQLAIAYGMTADMPNLYRYLDYVQRWVISNDEYASSPEGIECMLLQGKCFADIGQPQRCWSAWRRALLYAELRGLHRNHSASDYNDRIWWSLFIGDRFASLLLGVPYGINDQFCDVSVKEDPSRAYYALQQLQAKIGVIVGRVIDHIHSATTEVAQKAMILDLELENVASTMPSSWWDLPSALRYTDEGLIDLRLRASLQLCFYHVKTYLHLPLMLRSHGDAHYHYNTEVCVKSAREVLRRFLCLRKKTLGTVLDECRTIDFIGFTAAIILTLGLYGYNRNSRLQQGQQDSEDFRTLQESLQVFKDNSTAKEGRVAAKCFESLDLILGAMGPESAPSANRGCVLKLSIPFFGTISIVRRRLRSDIPYNVQQTFYMPYDDPSTGNHQLSHFRDTGPSDPGAVVLPDNLANALPWEDTFVEYSGLYVTDVGANNTSEGGPLGSGHPSTPWQDMDAHWVWWDNIFGNDRDSAQHIPL